MPRRAPGSPLDLSHCSRVQRLGVPTASRPEIPKALSLLGLPEGQEGPFRGLCPLLPTTTDGLRMVEEPAYTRQHCLGRVGQPWGSRGVHPFQRALWEAVRPIVVGVDHATVVVHGSL